MPFTNDLHCTKVALERNLSCFHPDHVVLQGLLKAFLCKVCLNKDEALRKSTQPTNIYRYEIYSLYVVW